MQSGHDAAKAKQPVPRWVPVVLVSLPYLTPLYLINVTAVAGSLHGGSERSHCFAEASAGGARFDKGPATKAESRALTNLASKFHGYGACCYPRWTNSTSKNAHSRGTGGPWFQRRTLLG